MEYVGKMRTLGDEMATAGRPLEDAELMEYIIMGLDEFFNPIVSALVARMESMFVDDLYSQLLAFKTLTEIISGDGGFGSPANMANQGGRGGHRGHGGYGHRYGNGHCGHSNGGNYTDNGSNNNNSSHQNTGAGLGCFNN